MYFSLNQRLLIASLLSLLFHLFLLLFIVFFKPFSVDKLPEYETIELQMAELSGGTELSQPEKSVRERQNTDTEKKEARKVSTAEQKENKGQRVPAEKEDKSAFAVKEKEAKEGSDKQRIEEKENQEGEIEAKKPDEEKKPLAAASPRQQEVRENRESEKEGAKTSPPKEEGMLDESLLSQIDESLKNPDRENTDSANNKSGSNDKEKTVSTVNGMPVSWDGDPRGRVPLQADNPQVPQDLASQLPSLSRIVISFTLLPSGLLSDLKIKRSSGNTRLDRIVKNAVSRWRFTPASGSEAVKGEISYSVVVK